MPESSPYVPALRFRWLTGAYDRLIAATLPEAELKRRLVAQAGLAPGQRILDLGCGTGTLTLMIKAAAPAAEVFGLDGDEDVLAIAREKVTRAGTDVILARGLAQEADLPAGSFDRVLSSLFFHHLRREDKASVLRRVHDLLRPGGELHVLDWGRAQDPLMRFLFVPVQLLDGFATTQDNVRGRLVSYMTEAGLAGAAETARRRTAFGTLSLYRATRPGGRAATP